MSSTLYAGVARRVINPELGTAMGGLRLFSSPIQAIESDLTGTVLVLSNQATKVAVAALDLAVFSPSRAAPCASAWETPSVSPRPTSC